MVDTLLAVLTVTAGAEPIRWLRAASVTPHGSAPVLDAIRAGALNDVGPVVNTL